MFIYTVCKYCYLYYASKRRVADTHIIRDIAPSLILTLMYGVCDNIITLKNIVHMSMILFNSLKRRGFSTFSGIPRNVNIVEVGPRDGLQNESNIISVDTKVQLISFLKAAGLKTIECGSFVSPKWWNRCIL